MRIVSLVPSLTEYLYDLGLDQEVVGITKFCVHPHSWYRDKTRIGGTKNPNTEKILGLKPSLIIANKEENRKEDIELLQPHCEILLTDINNFQEHIQALKSIAQAVNKQAQSKDVIQRIEENLKQVSPFKENISAVYLIWKDPIMSVAHPTFIHEMMEFVGMTNLANKFKEQSRYPSLSEEELRDLNPDLLLLSSEPYPFTDKHLLHFNKLLPNSKILIVDGEMFSWYGSRMQFFNNHWKALKQRIESLN